jgi:hypothetical protein
MNIKQWFRKLLSWWYSNYQKKKEVDNYPEVGQSENGCFGAPRQIQSKLSAFQWFSTVTYHGR